MPITRFDDPDTTTWSDEEKTLYRQLDDGDAIAFHPDLHPNFTAWVDSGEDEIGHAELTEAEYLTEWTTRFMAQAGFTR